MKHSATVEQQHATPRYWSTRVEIQPLNARNPGTAFLRREIETNRKAERWLVLKAIIALALVAALVVVRQVFFL